MIRLRIETEKPKYCVARDGIYIVRHIVRGKKGIRALIDLKKPSERAVVFVDEHPCPLAVKILDSGCIVTSAEVSDGRVVWNLVCSEEASVRLMNSVKCRIIEKRPFLQAGNVTYKEYIAVKKALERGFFDSPRGIKLEELAEELGISKSTLSSCLRRGLKKILRHYFEG